MEAMKLRIAIAIIPVVAVLVLQSTLGAQPATKSVWDGAYTDAQAARGKDLYRRNAARVMVRNSRAARWHPVWLAVNSLPAGMA